MEAARNVSDLDNVQLLNTAIASFNKKAYELEQSYLSLHEQVKRLNIELEEKNIQLEKNLKEKEQVKNFLSSIIESLPTGILVTDLQGNPLFCNSSMERITGSNPLEMRSTTLRDWYKKVQLDECFDDDPLRVHSKEIEFIKKKNNIRILHIIKSPVIDAHGEIIGILIIFQDQTQLRKLEQQFERDQRLKAMGEMAIRIAHEVRNPLGSIELLASILRNELEQRVELRNMADRIVTEVKSLNNSISNLLQFTRPQQPFLNQINFTEFLDEFITFIRPIVSKNGIELVVKPVKPIVFIAGDRDLLKQVFLNLTLNALQAMTDEGRIIISMKLYNDDSKGSSQWMEVSFSDTGCGIEPTEINKIFNPFYTTKEKGTGLGLAIVHNIIESHKGTIEVRSRRKRGTTFLISFPVTNIEITTKNARVY
ncbi:MAG: ATP-binding protein [Desulfobacterota bacterium]|nr:ATP-binding protein [Thermodesulfobacteriota bacterium]